MSRLKEASSFQRCSFREIQCTVVLQTLVNPPRVKLNIRMGFGGWYNIPIMPVFVSLSLCSTVQ